MSAATTRLKEHGAAALRRIERAYIAFATRGMRHALAQRNARRGGDRFHWFTPEEAETAAALARLIVPSDEETPGIDEVGVLGPDAVDELDSLVDGSTSRRHLYSRGLLSFDVWASETLGKTFARLERQQQLALLSQAQILHEAWTEGSVAERTWSRFRTVARSSGASLVAAQLYPELRDDCLQVFYTSRVAWVWLGYDGPPMYKGYPSVIVPR